MEKFNQLLKILEQEVPKLAQNILSGYATQAVDDVKGFMKSAESDLKNWMIALGNSEITSADLEFLIKGKKDLAEMSALKQIGLGEVAIDKFKEAMLNIIVSSVVKII